MVFKRVWDSSCPRVYDTWQADGKTWVIQDLPPEDDEEALDVLVSCLCADEALCAQSCLLDEPLSVESISEIWRHSLAQRTSLACYVEVDDKRSLVGLNCCIVACKGEAHPEVRGIACKNVFGVLEWLENKRDAFEYFGDDKFLSALGLVVKREFRGARIGGRLLRAREPLCKVLGLKATATVFTGPASQKLAEECGFSTLVKATWTELADAGLDYPRNDRVIKLSVKKYL